MTDWTKPKAAIAAIAVALMPLASGCSDAPADPLEAARAAYADAQPRTALDLVGQAIDANPGDAEPRMLAADIAIALGNPDRAIAELERVVSSETPPAIAKAKLLEAYVLGNYLTKARATRSELTLDHSHAFVAAVGLEMAEANFEEAFDQLDEGLEQFPDDHRLGTIDAERMLMLAQVEAAKERLAPILAAEPAVAEAHMLAGRMELANGELDRAETHFETALKLRPANQASMLAMAAIARDRKDESAAASWINQANSVGPPHPIGLLFAAQMAYDAGDMERAYLLVEKAPPAFKRQPQFARLSGFVEAARGQHSLAINPLQDYIASTGGDPVARRVLAESMVEEARFEEAWDVISPLVGHPHTDGGTLLLALRLASETGQGDTAEIERLIRAQDAAPDIAVQMRKAGEAIKAGDWATADGIYTPLVGGDGAESPVLLNNAAAVKSKLGQHAQAVALARRALAQAPAAPEIMDTLGWALWQEGENLGEARRLLTQARNAAPKNREINEHWAIAHAGT